MKKRRKEPQAKAQKKLLLLKMTLQNLKLKGKKFRFIWQKSFDKTAFYASR